MNSPAQGNSVFQTIRNTCGFSLYCILLMFIYRSWASPTYSYLGLIDEEKSIGPLVAASFILLLIVIRMPPRIQLYSDYFCWIILLVVLAPSMLIVSVMGHGSYDPYFLIVCLAISFGMMVGIPRLSLFRKREIPTPPRGQSFLIILLLLYALLTLFVLNRFWDIMSFAGLDEIYEQRSRATDSDAGVFAGYAALWLQNALNPYLIASGLMDKRRRWLLPIGLFGQVICYSIAAGKVVIASVLAMLCVHLFATRKSDVLPDRLAFGMMFAMIIVLAVLFQSDFYPSGIGLQIASILYMRTFAVQGAMTGSHADFFSFSEYTYGSHVNGFNLILKYPYDAPLGIVIGRYLVGERGLNANSNFWATDGIAGGGLIGVLLIGLIVGLCLAFANRLIPYNKLRFAAVVTVPYLMALSNVSFFTSLVTGGGAILLLLIAYGAPSREQSASGFIGTMPNNFPKRVYGDPRTQRWE